MQHLKKCSLAPSNQTSTIIRVADGPKKLILKMRSGSLARKMPETTDMLPVKCAIRPNGHETDQAHICAASVSPNCLSPNCLGRRYAG